MSLSYLIITYNRRDGLLSNLNEVFRGDPNADVWVVDNASADDTCVAVRGAFPNVRLIRLERNIGMPARNAALREMNSEFVAIIDDDSYPIGDALRCSTDYMETHPDVAAVVGRAVLPDGRSEASAFPSILLGCASCVRLRAVREVGYFPDDFFRQAEEYDLSCRLWNAGYRIARFEDVHYRHDKKPSASRASRDVTSLDLKHNLIIASRYLPDHLASIYRADFIQRYGAIMRRAGYGSDVAGVIAQADEYLSDLTLLKREPLSLPAFEAVFDHARQEEIVTRWACKRGSRRVAIADFSKNLFATYNACVQAGLHVGAIVDDRDAFAGLTYRGIPVRRSTELANEQVDGVIVSNINPAQVSRVCDETRGQFPNHDVLMLWQGANLRTSREETLAA